MVLLEHLLVKSHLLVDQLLLVKEHLVLSHRGFRFSITAWGSHHGEGPQEWHLLNWSSLCRLCSSLSLSFGSLNFCLFRSLCSSLGSIGFLSGLLSLFFFLESSGSFTLELLLLLLGSLSLLICLLLLFSKSLFLLSLDLLGCGLSK